jgi:ABC-type multidrug transport system fused ATPase/permease subunit
LDGKDINEYSDGERRGLVSIALQKPILFKGTIKSNVQLGKADATDEQIIKALEIAQASDIVKGKENGIYSAVEQGGRNFSGGQKQRLSLARAIVSGSEILILDDSSSALDYATDAKLRQAIKEMSEENDTTVIIVSQRATSIMHADKIIVLDDGEVAGMGTHEELLENNQVYKEIYMSQNALK